jgi:hypothetical protein
MRHMLTSTIKAIHSFVDRTESHDYNVCWQYLEDKGILPSDIFSKGSKGQEIYETLWSDIQREMLSYRFRNKNIYN